MKGELFMPRGKRALGIAPKMCISRAELRDFISKELEDKLEINFCLHMADFEYCLPSLKEAKDIIDKAGIIGNPHVRELDERDLSRIREIVEREKMVEGDLKRDINQNTRRLMDIGSYRGLRHRRGLPSRGQRTRTNGRTKRGRRQTVAGRRHTVAKK